MPAPRAISLLLYSKKIPAKTPLCVLALQVAHTKLPPLVEPTENPKALQLCTSAIVLCKPKIDPTLCCLPMVMMRWNARLVQN